MILDAYVDVYILCVCIVGHGYTTKARPTPRIHLRDKRKKKYKK